MVGERGGGFVQLFLSKIYKSSSTDLFCFFPCDLCICLKQYQDGKDLADHSEEEQYQPGDLIAVIHPGTAPWIGWLLERGTGDEWTLKWMEQVRENDHSEWQINNDYNPDTGHESSFLLTVAHADTCLSTAIAVPEHKWERATVLFNQHKARICGRGGWERRWGCPIVPFKDLQKFLDGFVLFFSS